MHENSKGNKENSLAGLGTPNIQTFNKAWVIDDDPLFIYGVNRLMKRVSFARKVEFFNNGLEAVNALNLLYKHNSHSKPDVILLDIDMPVWNGWDFLTTISGNHLMRELSIFVITSSRLQTDFDKASAYAFIRGFYRKPITSKNLREMMANGNLN